MGGDTGGSSRTIPRCLWDISLAAAKWEKEGAESVIKLRLCHGNTVFIMRLCPSCFSAEKPLSNGMMLMARERVSCKPPF